MHQVVIQSNGMNKTTVTLDGVDLSDVITEIKFIHKGGESPVMQIELKGCEISIRNPRIPQLPEILREFYKSVD